MLVILLPGTTLTDWIDDPTLRQLMDQGAVGLMNTRTARMPDDKHREPPAAAVLTLSAGARAASGASGVLHPAYARSNFGPSYEDLWRRRMGYSSGRFAAPGPLVDPGWPKNLAVNHNLGYDIHLGNLADALRAHGIYVLACTAQPSIIYDDGLDRSKPQVQDTYCAEDPDNGFAALLAAGSDGTANGFVYLPDAETVSAGFATVDLGNSLDKASDSLVRIVTDAKQTHTRLLILSPFVDDRAYAAGDRLAPVLMLGDDVPRGLLTSPSTRRPGLITNTDIAPAIAAYFGVTLPTAAVGRPVKFAPSPDPVDQLHALRTMSLEQRQGQRILPFCAVLFGLLLAALAACRLKDIQPRRILYAAFAIPWIIFILASTNTIAHLAFDLVMMAGVSIVIAPLRPILRIAPFFMLSAFLLLDCVNGGRLGGVMLLGYSPIEGARYYGIGNEAMGALVGAMLVLFTMLWERSPSIRAGVVAAMIASIAIVGAPSMGAKAGGVIVLAGAFAVFLWTSTGRKLTVGGFLGAALLGIILLGAMALADSARSSTAQSHMGAAVDLIRHGGAGQAVDIVVRKLAVELKLATHSTWALPVWAGLVCLLLQRRNTIASGRQARIALADSTLVAATLMLLFNDAGAVACALCLSLVCSYLAVVDNAEPARETISISSSEPVPNASQ